MTGYSAEAKDGKTKLTPSEIEQLHAGKTAYFQNGEIEYHREDGVTFYKNKKKREIVSGKWFTKENHICYRYYSDYDKVSCHKTFKKGNSVIHNGKVITLKMGDTENLQKAYLSYSSELSSSDVEQLYAGKTAYFSNKTFKKGNSVTYDGKVITLKMGDTENIQKTYHSQAYKPCPSWKELAPKSTQLELLTLLGVKKIDGELASQAWTPALFDKYYQKQQKVQSDLAVLNVLGFGWDPVGLRYSQVLTVILLIPPCK
ncbi:MAG: hypothetical protein ABFS56_28590 [Pseudomonadota bacterium]